MAPDLECFSTLNKQKWETTHYLTSLLVVVNVTDNIVYVGLLRQASGKQQWPHYRHRYTSLAYKRSTDNANLERNTHIYRHTRWNTHVISLAGISGLLDLQTHFTIPFWHSFFLLFGVLSPILRAWCTFCPHMANPARAWCEVSGCSRFWRI